MSQLRLVPRCLALLALAFAAACGSTHHQQDTSGRPACPGAVDDRQAPVVCVDATGGTPLFLPDPVIIHDVKYDDASAPVPIKWFVLPATRTLHVEMVGSGCVDQPSCNGPQCTSKSVPGQKDPKICKYNVWIDRGLPTETYVDPTVIITGCCT